MSVYLGELKRYRESLPRCEKTTQLETKKDVKTIKITKYGMLILVLLHGGESSDI